MRPRVDGPARVGVCASVQRLRVSDPRGEASETPALPCLYRALLTPRRTETNDSKETLAVDLSIGAVTADQHQGQHIAAALMQVPVKDPS